MSKSQATMQPTDAEVRVLAERMAQKIDVNVRDAEYAIRRMLARGLIEMVAVQEKKP